MAVLLKCQEEFTWLECVYEHAFSQDMLMTSADVVSGYISLDTHD